MKKLDVVYFEDFTAVYIDGELDFFTAEALEDVDWLDIASRAGVQAGYVDATHLDPGYDGEGGPDFPSTLSELSLALEA